MRALLGRRIARAPVAGLLRARVDERRCRAMLLEQTLRDALAEVGDLARRDGARRPARSPTPATCDQLDFIAAGAIEIAPTPWQDRGSFQIAAEPGAAHGG